MVTSSGGRRISWLFFKARAKRPYLSHTGRVRQSPMRVNTRKPFKSLPTQVGTRSRGSRRRLSDHDIRCSVSERRWFPARPAQHVHRRRNNGKGPLNPLNPLNPLAKYNRHSRARMAEMAKDGARHATPMRVNIRKPCKSLAIDYGFFDHKTAYQRPRTRTTTRPRTIREAGGSKQESHLVKIPYSHAVYLQF